MKKRGSPLQKDDGYWGFRWARNYVRQLGFTKRMQWNEYCESGDKPDSVPSDPDKIYAEEWLSWSDWLGTVSFWGFVEARNFVYGLGLKNAKEWEVYCQSGEKPPYIPANPGMAYRKEWQGMDDWLGLETPTKFEREFLPFEDAKAIVHKLGFKSSKEWKAHCQTRKRHVAIPTNPDVVYAQKWKGWRDWLGIATSDKSEHSRLSDLEGALLQLHDAQSLTSGQIMILLRHAGILSKRYFLHTFKRLHSDDGAQSDEVRSQIAALEAAIEEENESISSSDMDDFERKESSAPQLELEEVIPPASSPDEVPNLWGTDIVPTSLPRDREAEVKELRGWSAVGNLLDPSPALIQLCMTRLKTAFYRFANDLRISLDAQAQHDLHKYIWDVAFSEYGDLIEENELLQASCERYTRDLAAALLLHRSEQMKTPRLYQLDGARFLADRLLSEEHPYGLLFDEPGMGKTLTVLWALAAAYQERFIIVAPLTVKKDVWTFTDLRTAFPSLKEDLVATSLASALKLPTEGPAVAILHYEELRKLDQIERLSAPRSDGSLPFDAVIFDEAHSVKTRRENKSTNADSEQRKGAQLLRRGARACIGLTATPLVNDLYEPISLLHLTKQQQDKDIHLKLNSRKLRDRVDVMEYLLQDTMRRQKQQVLFEIPPRKITTISITPTSEQMGEIEAFLNMGRRTVGTQLPYYRRLMMDVKLDWIEQRVKAHNDVSTDDDRLDSKLLILCYNRDGISQQLYSRLVSHLGTSRIAHVNGNTPIEERKQIFSRFRQEERGCSDDLTVLVGTIGTVGMGVTLFDATGGAVTPHRVIFADLPFTWAEFEQGVDRLHRIGQKFPVEIEVPLVSYGEQLTSAEGGRLLSFDEWVWEIISRKQVLSDQVLDAVYDVSEYTGKAVRNAISNSLKNLERDGGPVIAPAPPEESEQSKHRHQVARYRGMPRRRVAEMFSEPNVSKQFLEMNDASPSAKLAQKLVRERLAQWLDRRSIVVDLGCGSNPLRDLPCANVIGVDRHGINGGLIGDSAETGLPGYEADFVVFSLSMWGTPEDRLAYLREAKRLLRPIGRLIIVEPMQTFGDVHTWKTGVIRLKSVLNRLGMQLDSMSEHLIDSGARLVTVVATNSTHYPNEPIDPHDCFYAS